MTAVEPTAPGVRLRAARAEDDATIRALIRAERLDPTSLDWRRFVVAEDEAGRIVGIGQVKHLPGARELGSLVVRHEWRRRGIGALLIAALIAREPGTLYLLSRDTRAPYYRRFGFREVPLARLPWAMRGKLLLGQVARLAGVRVVVMRRDGGV